MSLILFTLVVALASFGAGLLGALTGLGGGVVLVPVLTIGFGVDFRYAAGASLVSVIATSSGAAAAFVREGLANIRVGMFLEVATTAGALGGAYLAARIATGPLSMVFGVVLIGSAVTSWLPWARVAAEVTEGAGSLGQRLRLDGVLSTAEGPRPYRVRRLPLGFTLMALAGAISGLLGIGSGAVKVLAMDWAMGLPLKVSTTTSNFMIGVTAAASAGVYLGRGYVDPGLAAPVMLGVLAGSLVGARLLVTARVKTIRIVFTVVVLALALEMIRRGVAGARP
jgi:uncharacterized membrane protein YfcA